MNQIFDCMWYGRCPDPSARIQSPEKTRHELIQLIDIMRAENERLSKTVDLQTQLGHRSNEDSIRNKIQRNLQIIQESTNAIFELNNQQLLSETHTISTALKIADPGKSTPLADQFLSSDFSSTKKKYTGVSEPKKEAMTKEPKKTAVAIAETS